MDWKERIEDFWDEVKDHAYYIIGVSILILAPFIIGAPAADLPENNFVFSLLNGIYKGQKLPILSDIYALARDDIELFKTNIRVLDILALCAIWAIFAASWDLLSGYTGQVSFGHAFFWGIAAYASFWFVEGMDVCPGFETLLGERYTVDPLLGLFLGAGVAALMAIIVGLIALRVKGPYLALVTLVLPFIFDRLVVIFDKFTVLLFCDINTGKDAGRSYYASNIPRIIPFGINKELANWKEIYKLNFYIFTILILFIALGLMMLIAFSRFGLIFQAIREDEEAAESLGINLSLYKILAFTLSAFFAGLAGGLYGQYLGAIGPSYFGSSFSFTAIIMVVVGGVGSITGGVIGAFFLTILVELFLSDVFYNVTALDLLAYGFLLVVTLRYMRFGLVRAKKEEKKGIVIGILFALSWTLVVGLIGFDALEALKNPLESIKTIQNGIQYSPVLPYLTLAGNSVSSFYVLLLLFLFALPAIPIFLISEIIGITILNEILGLALVKPDDLIKAKFLIYACVGIPYSYYLPKLFKKLRLRFWGVWPSVGRYEPD